MKNRFWEWGLCVSLFVLGIGGIMTGELQTKGGIPIPAWASYPILGWACWLLYQLVKERLDRKNNTTDGSGHDEE
jgi:hypothetical protein